MVFAYSKEFVHIMCWHKFVCNTLLLSFRVCSICSDVATLIPNVDPLCIYLLLHRSVWLEVHQFLSLYFSKNQLWVSSIILLFKKFKVHWFHPYSYFLFSISFDFICSLFPALKVQVKFVGLRPYPFQIEGFRANPTPLDTALAASQNFWCVFVFIQLRIFHTSLLIFCF